MSQESATRRNSWHLLEQERWLTPASLVGQISLNLAQPLGLHPCFQDVEEGYPQCVRKPRTRVQDSLQDSCPDVFTKLLS